MSEEQPSHHVEHLRTGTDFYNQPPFAEILASFGDQLSSYGATIMAAGYFSHDAAFIMTQLAVERDRAVRKTAKRRIAIIKTNPHLKLAADMSSARYNGPINQNALRSVIPGLIEAFDNQAPRWDEYVRDQLLGSAIYQRNGSYLYEHDPRRKSVGKTERAITYRSWFAQRSGGEAVSH